MAAFETVSPDHFLATLEAAPRSAACKRVLATLDHHRVFHSIRGARYAVRHGSLTLSGPFEPPSPNMIIVGDLTVDGAVDLNCPEADEGGCFILLGSLRCTAFSGHYGKATIIDGDLIASDLLVNAFEDSCLYVTGSLRTKFFFGSDIWAEIGGTAEMEYGEGYCLPIGYTDAARQAIRPRHDRKTLLERLNRADAGSLGPQDFVEALARGVPLFRAPGA